MVSTALLMCYDPSFRLEELSPLAEYDHSDLSSEYSRDPLYSFYVSRVKKFYHQKE